MVILLRSKNFTTLQILYNGAVSEANGRSTALIRELHTELHFNGAFGITYAVSKGKKWRLLIK